MPIDDHTRPSKTKFYSLSKYLQVGRYCILIPFWRRRSSPISAVSTAPALAGRPTPAIKALCSVLLIPPSSKHISPLPPPFSSESRKVYVSGAAFSPAALSCSCGGKCSLDPLRLETYVHTERLLTAFLRYGQCHVSPVGHCIDEARSKLKDPG